MPMFHLHYQLVEMDILNGYRKILPRICAEIGYIKLVDLRPQHLNAFYRGVYTDTTKTEASNRVITYPAELTPILFNNII